MVEIKNFLIKGTLKLSSGDVPFSKQIEGASKLSAENKIKSTFGSNYRLKRNRILISSVEEVQ